MCIKSSINGSVTYILAQCSDLHWSINLNYRNVANTLWFLKSWNVKNTIHHYKLHTNLKIFYEPQLWNRTINVFLKSEMRFTSFYRHYNFLTFPFVVNNLASPQMFFRAWNFSNYVTMMFDYLNPWVLAKVIHNILRNKPMFP